MSAPIKEIGEAVVSDSDEGGRDYRFRPSFAAMNRIGKPEEIVGIYSILNGQLLLELTQRLRGATAAQSLAAVPLHHRVEEKTMTAAMRVISACCEDDVTEVVGEWVGDDEGVHYVPGWLETHDMIVMATHFMQHGIIGKAKVRQLQRHETNQTTTAFNAIEYINAARIHLDMTRAEAEQLTMTEFQMLLAQKYPDQKGFTREEYDDITDDFLAKQAARRAAAEATA